MIIALGLPTVASLFGALWLFANPRELRVNEARALAAKQPARVAFWSVAAALLIDSGRFVAIRINGVPCWAPLPLPVAVAISYVVYRVGLAHTHPGILETASEELVKRWKHRLPVGRGLLLFAALMSVWAVVRFWVL